MVSVHLFLLFLRWSGILRCSGAQSQASRLLCILPIERNLVNPVEAAVHKVKKELGVRLPVQLGVDLAAIHLPDQKGQLELRFCR